MFKIKDEVKRSKAAQLAGHNEIRAKVFADRHESESLGERVVRMEDLLSPRPSFPVHNRDDGFGVPLEDQVHRWIRIRSGADSAELPFPPIRGWQLEGYELAMARDGCVKVEDVQLGE
ncbi:MAG: hypothetical protein F4X40_03610 [Chloroflexi bacterium]|nr:hypothetical protein [Chloroflexota bacterium]